MPDFYPYFKSTSDAVSNFFTGSLTLIDPDRFVQQAAFTVFDKDGNGDITKPEMREAVRRIYRERRALTASLKVSFRYCLFSNSIYTRLVGRWLCRGKIGRCNARSLCHGLYFHLLAHF